MSEALRIRSSDGLELEAAIDAPDGSARGVLVFCHPHPKMGGTMNAPLILAVRDGLVARGWEVLRFNFRGIGASEGEASDGIAEVADAEGALAAVRERHPTLPVSVAGWSFGAAVALRLLKRHPEIAACAAIAPAIAPKPGITAGSPEAASFDYPGPVLVVCGGNDDQVDPHLCRSWADETGALYEEVRGANHFFWGRYERLAALVGGFLEPFASARVWKESSAGRGTLSEQPEQRRDSP